MFASASPEAGVRKANRKDLTVFLLRRRRRRVAGVFTQNRFCAAPVQVCREHLGGGAGIRALVINTGNANAGTGADGLADARATCAALAGADWAWRRADPAVLHRRDHGAAAGGPHRWPACRPRWPTPRPTTGREAAEGIMTTDTVPKAASRQVQLGGKTVTVTGISKGAGMIRPNMATMLGFLATDASVAPGAAAATGQASWPTRSFNRMTIDGDTSTNDSLRADGHRPGRHAPITDLDSADGQAAQGRHAGGGAQAGPGHRARRRGRDQVHHRAGCEGGKTAEECRQVAYAIAHSPLVKTAFFASDPNLGRILAAVGYAGIADLDQSLIDLHLGRCACCRDQGGRNPAYREEDGQRVMQQSEITVRVRAGPGRVPRTPCGPAT